MKKKIEQIIQRRRSAELLEDIEKQLLRQTIILNKLCELGRSAKSTEDKEITNLAMCLSDIGQLVDELKRSHKRVRREDKK